MQERLTPGPAPLEEPPTCCCEHRETTQEWLLRRLRLLRKQHWWLDKQIVLPTPIKKGVMSCHTVVIMNFSVFSQGMVKLVNCRFTYGWTQFFWRGLPFPSVFFWLFLRWTCEICPKDLLNIASCTSCYVHMPCSWVSSLLCGFDSVLWGLPGQIRPVCQGVRDAARESGFLHAPAVHASCPVGLLCGPKVSEYTAVATAKDGNILA